MTTPATSINPPEFESAAFECPRCGYDQRGITLGWKEACPRSGTCTECGLELDFGALREQRGHQWLFEHGSGNLWKDRVRLRTTGLRIMLPWLFWSQVEMRHLFNWRRAFASAGVMILAGWAAFGLARILAYFAVGLFESIQRGFISPTAMGNALLRIETQSWKTGGLWSGFIAYWYTLTSLMYAAMPISLHQYHVLKRHLVRIWLYSIVFGILWVQCAYLTSWAMATFRAPIPMWYIRNRWLLIACLGAGGIVFHWAAIRFYLRIPHAAITAILFGIAGALAVMAVPALLYYARYG